VQFSILIDLLYWKIPLFFGSVFRDAYPWSLDDAWIAIGTVYGAFNDVRLFSYETGEEVIIRLDGMPLTNPRWRNSNE
jgi:hypothetical protein